MRFLFALSTALLLAPTPTPMRAQTPAPAPWLLAFNGRSTNALAMDRRLPAFLQNHITHKPMNYWTGKPTIPAKDAIEFLHGPPDDVHVANGHDLTASACVAHDAMDCGLLWVNTQTGATIFAAKVYRNGPPAGGNTAHLWLFTNTALKPQALPPTFTAAVAQWSAQPNGDDSHTLITDITLVQPDGTELRLSRDDAHTWQPAPGAPTATKPAGK